MEYMLPGRSRRQVMLTTVRMLLLAAIPLLLCSCGYKRNALLFKTTEKIKKTGLPLYRVNADSSGKAEEPYRHILKPDDRISIRFLNNYKLSEGVTLQGISDGEVSFLVSNDSTVTLPTVGQVKVAGLTRDSVARQLETLYASQFYANIEVLIVGLSVTILGEVREPGVYELARERTSIVDLVGLAGSVTQYGKPDRVFVYRKKVDGEYEILLFDLTKLEVLESDELIVHDKDIIYVEPRKMKLLMDLLLPYVNVVGIAVSISALVVTLVKL